jgi:phage shock protein C
MKRLYKSETEKKLFGACGGFAEYMDVDPVLVRVGYAFITAVTGFIPGMIAYPVLAWIMPTKSEVTNG